MLGHPWSTKVGSALSYHQTICCRKCQWCRRFSLYLKYYLANTHGLDRLDFQNAIELTSCDCNYASFQLLLEERYWNQANKRQEKFWIEWMIDPTSCRGTEYSVQLSLMGLQNLAKTQQDQHLGFQNAIKQLSCNCDYASFWLSPEERY
jgi:hypothetical protein